MEMENKPMYPEAGMKLNEEKAALAPDIIDHWRNFSRAVYKEGTLSEKTKQLIAVAVAHVTQCPYCIKGHTAQAMRKGATEQEIMEAIWIAAEMRAGASYAHANLAMQVMDEKRQEAK